MFRQVRNTRTVNRTGQLTGYKLIPGSNCLLLSGPEAKFLRRAAFLKHNLFIFGITHVPRLEDWPVMPVEHIGFMLQPSVLMGQVSLDDVGFVNT
ncbi:hypothetical protein RHSIM_Rhsim06G0094200 [Rhododendron simsii]|uniref:Amine oxidase n=1 Tax=Rhododendron simsii TaxID=118357 RepID=A0A834GR59_RHOSS|nr:hypothetical protein RHSIM_Rhsim06G0094200 [Rhododendron simsii]